MFLVTTTLALVFITGLVIYWYRRDSRLPAGPRGIPIFGINLFLGSDPTKKFMEWSRKYGTAYTARFGNTDMVVLTDYDVIHDVHIRQASKMGARPELTVHDACNQGIGLIFASPKISDIHRPFTRQAMRRLGLGKNTMETRIQQEASYLVEAIREKSGKPFDTSRLFLYTAFNISCLNTLGERYPYDDKILQQVGSELVDEVRHYGKYIFLIGSSKYLPHFAPFKTSMQNYINDFNHLAEYFEKKINEHESSYDENEMRDYIDIFLQEMKKDEHDPSFNKRQLLVALHNMLDAGSQTLSCTLTWCMIALIKYPKYYKILRDEVDAVVGSGRKVSLSDRKNMPQTLAFYHELMRRCTLVKSFFGRTIVDGVDVNGYKLPKNTTIQSVTWSIHNDPKCFPDPDKFQPERFLNLKDGTFQKSKYWMPFAIGKRNCIGDQLAQMELFILLVSLIQNFDISVHDGTKIPSLDDGVDGIVFTPPALDLVFTSRE
uniref:cytochrome P450 2C30-like n=1 Tax=Styela clava TaxID=7725 RepID=UPI00193A601F|nr:cytochrome P450 2C30-like [Styela clava]